MTQCVHFSSKRVLDENFFDIFVFFVLNGGRENIFNKDLPPSLTFLSIDIKYDAQERIKSCFSLRFSHAPNHPSKKLEQKLDREQRGTGLTVARTNALPVCCIDPDDVLQHSNIFAS